MPDPTHIFTGKVGPAPQKFGTLRAWYHIVCAQVGTHAPCQVSLTEAGLVIGDRIDPGSCIDLYAPDGVWVVGPLDGQPAWVGIETRLAPSYRSVSPMGERLNITSWKAGGDGKKLTPGQWNPVITNVVGMVGAILRVTGNGPAWVGTHQDVGQAPEYAGTPPHLTNYQVHGGAFPIFPGDPPITIEGNPWLFAWAYESDVTLHFTKLARGRHFVEKI